MHRRVIVCDYGKPIYKASSPVALLAVLERCIEGCESLHKNAGMLQRDISINNLMMNEEEDSLSWKSFVIDLHLAIKEQREGLSGANGKTGTRSFMAIGVLLGKGHSYMHDCESFFWVPFWICIHCNGPNEQRVVPRYEKWKYMDMVELAVMKRGEISGETDFLEAAQEHFTPYYQPLIRCVNKLRKVVFPNGLRWEKPNPSLFFDMKETLQVAREELKISAE